MSVVTGSVYITPGGEQRVYSDETTGNDKVISVPAGRRWQILWIFCNFQTTATVGNRLLLLEIRDRNNDVRYKERAPNTQSESDNLDYVFAPGYVRGTTTGQYMACLPCLTVLGHGWDIRIRDAYNVDANDTLKVYVVVLEDEDI